jgi:tRNA pseudouridine38-40 synthase
MRRYKLLIEYDGSGFYGFQIQKEQLTIQGVLEEALSKLFQRPIGIFAAGRTDAGVHAYGQVIHFDVNQDMPLYKIQEGLNFYMRPFSVSVLQIEEKDNNFHARFSAQSRSYRYIILNRRAPSPLLAKRAWPIKYDLDHEKMRKASQILIGQHDFSSFRAAECQAKSPIKTINKIEIVKHDDLIYLDIEALSFLHHMVRNIVGSLQMVGSGKWSIEDFQKVLEAKNRSFAGQTAPACGLYFMKVDY